MIMTKWTEAMKLVTLPQHLAILSIPFQLADPLNKGVAHPRELSKAIQHCPAAIRVPGANTISEIMKEVEIEVPLAVIRSTGQVDQVLSRSMGSPTTTGTSDEELKALGKRKVTYELPVTWDEILALHILHGEDGPFDSMRVQVLTILGVCQMFTGQLEESETNMKEAVLHATRAGLDNHVGTCELFNSIAQLMIMKHRQWHAEKKNRCRDLATSWINTPEGRKEWKEEEDSLLSQGGHRDHKDPQNKPRKPGPTRDEARQRARTILLRARARHFAKQEEDPTLPSVEAAYRYLTKSFDLLSHAHGSLNHASIGAACLAVASGQNMVDSLPGAEEWLRINHVLN
jgi:hypothetical protein